MTDYPSSKRADQVGGVDDPHSIKIGYRSRSPRWVIHLCVKVGYSSAKY